MNSSRISNVVAAFAVASLVVPAARAQSHNHYAESAQTARAAPSGQLAPLLKDLGRHRFPVTTRSKEAQSFVDQGVMLAYGFNHAEAGRSFREAAQSPALENAHDRRLRQPHPMQLSSPPLSRSSAAI